MVVMLIPVAGCAKTPEIVDFIYISPEVTQPPSVIVPPGEHTPFPKEIQLTVSPGEKIFIILGISENLEDSVTFTRYAYYNKETKQEVGIETANDLGPFGAGADVLVGYSNPWPVPDQPSVYEVRVYLDKKVVASAVFKVQ